MDDCTAQPPFLLNGITANFARTNTPKFVQNLDFGQLGEGEDLVNSAKAKEANLLVEAAQSSVENLLLDLYLRFPGLFDYASVLLSLVTTQKKNLDTLTKAKAQALANGRASSLALSVLLAKAATERFESCKASGLAYEESQLATLTAKLDGMRVDKLAMSIEEKAKALPALAEAQDWDTFKANSKALMVLSTEKSKLELELKLQQEKEDSALADASNAAEEPEEENIECEINGLKGEIAMAEMVQNAIGPLLAATNTHKVPEKFLGLAIALAQVPVVSDFGGQRKALLDAAPGIRQNIFEAVRKESALLEAVAEKVFNNILDVEARDQRVVAKGNWSSVKIAQKMYKPTVAQGAYIQLATAFVTGACYFQTSEANTVLLKKLVDTNQRLLDLID